MRNDVKRLSDRPYQTILRLEPEEGGVPGYLATHPEFGDQCMAQGETPQEAIENLNEVREMVIEHLVDSGLPVPDPLPATGTVVVSFTSTLSVADPEVRIIAPSAKLLQYP